MPRKTSKPGATMKNSEIIERLHEISDLLEEQGANVFRVDAYRRAAETVENLEQPVSEIVEKRGFEGLTELPSIGEGIARSIYEYVAMGHMSRLESLRAGHDPVAVFQQIPSIGVILANRIVDTLHIDTLEALEIAAHNGRLAKIPGLSTSKVINIKSWLAQVLGGRRLRQQGSTVVPEPTVGMILEIDRQYRERAEAGDLPKIAPRRFNPDGTEWLPIMHTARAKWHFTVLFSNSARAHQLGRTGDWVVIYFYDQDHHEGQSTVVVEYKGVLTGKRVVRGREHECLDHYFQQGELIDKPALSA